MTKNPRQPTPEEIRLQVAASLTMAGIPTTSEELAALIEKTVKDTSQNRTER